MSFFYQVIRYSSPTSAGAECIDPDCSWVEQWYYSLSVVCFPKGTGQKKQANFLDPVNFVPCLLISIRHKG